MPTFGFSAFLRLICMNDRPQRTEIRNRTIGGGDGGYDYHASMRRLAADLTEGRLPIESVLAKALNIRKESERKSAMQALSNLSNWLSPLPQTSIKFNDALYTSPDQNFSVRFTSNFGVVIGPKTTAIHIWNTMTPDLSDNLVRMALALVSSAYSESKNPPQDLGVLDLRKSRLILLSEATLAPNSGLPLAARLDRIFQAVKAELENRDRPTDSPGISPL